MRDSSLHNLSCVSPGLSGVDTAVELCAGIIALGTCAARRPVDEMVDVYQHRAKEIWLPHRNRDRLVVGGVTLNGGGKYDAR